MEDDNIPDLSQFHNEETDFQVPFQEMQVPQTTVPEVAPQPEEPRFEFMSSEEVKRRRGLITKLAAAKSKWPDLFAALDLSNTDIQSLTIQELELCVEDFKVVLSSQASFGMFVEFAKLLTQLAESLGSIVGLELEGFSAAVNKNPEFEKCVDEIAWQNCDKLNISPEKRLMFIVVSTAMTVHSTNKLLKKPKAESKVESKLESKLKSQLDEFDSMDSNSVVDDLSEL